MKLYSAHAKAIWNERWGTPCTATRGRGQSSETYFASPTVRA